jgi:hypothetical protein
VLRTLLQTLCIERNPRYGVHQPVRRLMLVHRAFLVLRVVWAA